MREGKQRDTIEELTLACYSSPESLQETLQLEEDALEFNSKGTIVAKGVAADTHAHFTLGRLPRLSLSEELEVESQASMAELDLKETIGEGGMGVIYRAIQLPLQREVAVKGIHPEKRSPVVMMALLREAWITGGLQHPNIVPVHVLGSHPDGSPMFVMKRISGVTWDVLMHDPHHPLRRSSGRDHLAWNLEILMQVCNAVHFAHSKGILHRDLKPENVMLGSFGEVYVLDWGLAVSINEEEVLPLPRASESKEIVGTPAYMAPEMATGQAALLSERTDVYLLGAILHEILVKHPIHLGEGLMDVLFAAATSEPYEYPERLPQKLVEICRCATSRHPDDRFESADSLRRALAHFLECRTSIELSEQASRQLEQLRRRVQVDIAAKDDDFGAEDDDFGADLEERRLRLYGLYHESKLGFEQALRIWSANDEAESKLQQLHETMTYYEISQGDAKAAMLHFAALKAPSGALREQLDALIKERREQAERLEALQQLEQDLDLGVGARTRALIDMLLGFLFLPYLLMFGQWGWFEYQHLHHIGTSVGFAVIIIILGIWARESMTKTAINRRLGLSFLTLAGLMIVQATSAWLLDMPPKHALIQQSFLYVLCLTSVAIFVEMRLFWGALIYFLSAILSVLFPAWMFEIMGVGFSSGMLLVAHLWKPDSWQRTSEERAARQAQMRQEKKSGSLRDGD